MSALDCEKKELAALEAIFQYTNMIAQLMRLEHECHVHDNKSACITRLETFAASNKARTTFLDAWAQYQACKRASK